MHLCIYWHSSYQVTIPLCRLIPITVHYYIPGYFIAADVIWTCTFNDWCDIKQDELDDVNWYMVSGRVSDDTGPSSAYTGNYYILHYAPYGYNMQAR